jgi:hypothetical protein
VPGMMIGPPGAATSSGPHAVRASRLQPRTSARERLVT